MLERPRFIFKQEDERQEHNIQPAPRNFDMSRRSIIPIKFWGISKETMKRLTALLYRTEPKNNKILLYKGVGNFVGSQFDIYSLANNSEELVATVCYKTEVSCNSYRKEDILRIVIKEPTLREDLKVYMMNFKGKSKMSSSKNMVLRKEDQADSSLLFCKQGINNYYLQFNSYFNLLVAMGILLSSFDFKLACR